MNDNFYIKSNAWYSTEPPLTLTKLKLIPLYQLENYEKNLNQDIKSPEKNHFHWASSDVMENDVISDDVIFSIDSFHN